METRAIVMWDVTCVMLSFWDTFILSILLECNPLEALQNLYWEGNYIKTCGLDA